MGLDLLQTNINRPFLEAQDMFVFVFVFVFVFILCSFASRRIHWLTTHHCRAAILPKVGKADIPLKAVPVIPLKVVLATHNKLDNKVIFLRAARSMAVLHRHPRVLSKSKVTSKLCLKRFRRRDCRHSIRQIVRCWTKSLNVVPSRSIALQEIGGSRKN
jgi:hypothetical protein